MRKFYAFYFQKNFSGTAEDGFFYKIGHCRPKAETLEGFDCPKGDIKGSNNIKYADPINGPGASSRDS